MKKNLFLFLTAGLIFNASANPLEAIAKALAKLAPESGTTSKGAAAGRATEDAAAGSPKLNPFAEAPKPMLRSDPVGKTKEDVIAYKLLQNKAIQGDSVAMMSMTDMTLSGKISDPGELHRAYWLFQASKVNTQAVAKLRDECQSSVDKRLTDQLFNSACATTDGRIDYLGSRLTRQTNPFLLDYATPKK